MNIRIAHILCTLLLSIGMQAQDTTALDYFNRASREYLKVDKLTALRTLDQGLRQFPGDPRMLKLAEELLKEEQKQQQQGQQKKEDQEKKDQEKKDQEKNEQQQNEGQENKPDPQEEEKGGNEQQKDHKPEQEQGQQRKPETIAPQDARRMLDALDRKEKEVQDKVRIKQRPASRVPIEKDW